MKGKLQIRKPENWQDFETLCKKLWGEIWQCENTIKKNGRSGQNQSGVDICGMPKGENQYYGIQCKGKDDYTQSQLTEKEIDTEIEKAKLFKPQLNSFYIVTTANKDAKIEEYIRQKNIESISKNGFNIDVFSWEDIVDLIEDNKKTYNWYIHDLMYSDAYNISLEIIGDSKTMPTVIFPKFIKKVKKYKVKTTQLLNDPVKRMFSGFEFRGLPPNLSNSEIDNQWCNLYLKITNNGSLALESYKIGLEFDSLSIEGLDEMSGHIYNYLLSENVRHEINRSASERQTVFSYDDCENALLIEAKKDLIQTDSAVYNFAIKPKYGHYDMNILWELKAKNFQTSGKCIIKIKSLVEEETEIIYVDSNEELLPDEISIVPQKVIS